MKKFTKVLLIAALCVAAATTTASAQFYYGVKAGANLLSGSVKNAANIGLTDAKSEFGYQAGVVVGAKVPIIGIGVEAEALWVNSKLSFAEGVDINSNSIEIPVMASIPILPVVPIRIKVGPTFMVYNKSKMTVLDALSTELDPIKSSIGYTVGLGAKLWKITLDVRYNGQFKAQNIGNYEINNQLSPYDLKTNNVSLMVGYRF